MQEKLLSKELSYEIIKQQLDLDHTIEQNYKDQQYALHHEKIESVLEAKPEPPVSESVPSPKEEGKKNSEQLQVTKLQWILRSVFLLPFAF